MDHVSIEVALLEAVIEGNWAFYVCWGLVNCIEITDPMHGVVPARNTRVLTCGHLMHRAFAHSIFGRYLFLREYEVDEGIILIEWSYNCHCGFVGNLFCSADLSLWVSFV